MAALWFQDASGRTHNVDLTGYADLSVLNQGDAEIVAVSTSWAGRSATILHHRLPTLATEITHVSAPNARETLALLRNFAEHYRSGGLFGFAVDEESPPGLATSPFPAQQRARASPRAVTWVGPRV